ncbi:MAG: TIGR00282 family metallophosphoesterase [bacterium]|nr:TIGR00282 family metallophosphoesterase [bacterium]
MYILVFGDVVGKGGREATKQFITKFRKENPVDFIIINGENLAHGKGITGETFREMTDAGVKVFTSGNHVWDIKQAFELLQKESNLLRPANFMPTLPGKGSVVAEIGMVSIAVLNINGRVFFNEDYDDPFRAVDQWLATLPRVKPLITLVDFHGEATSEKRAMGFYLDGKVSAMWGTHTHVPTADEQILMGGTAYISDVGMTGALNSTLGVRNGAVLERFKNQIKVPLDVVEEKPWEVNAVYLDIDESSGKARSIKRVREIITD